MNSRILVALTAAIVMAIPSMATAQVPAEVPVQGFLTDDQGVPIDGSVSIAFTIYDAAVSGTELHTQTETVGADAGAFTVYLTPNLAIFEDNSELYLGLAVDGEAEMSPRLKMGSVPYAAVAGNASTLEGMSASDFASSSYTPDWSEIQNVPADIADGDDDTTTPDWSDVQNVPADIADGDADTTYTASGAVSIDASNNISLNSSCSSGQVLKWDAGISAWTCEDDTDTTYTAGTGLALNSGTFSASGIRNTHISSNANIRASKIEANPSFDGTVSGSDFEYRSTRTRNLTIPVHKFVNTEGADADDSWRFDTSQGYGYISDLGESSLSFDLDLAAPVDLPPSATVTEAWCYYYGGGQGYFSEVRMALRKNRLRSGESGVQTQVMYINDLPSGMTTNGLAEYGLGSLNEQVDEDSAYWMDINLRGSFVGPNSNMRFYGCRLVYTTDGPLY
jgi:hypothetical protein